MNKLDRLNAELCPNGVEFVPLAVVARISNGKDHKHLADGEYPVYGSGGIMRYAEEYIYDKESVLIPRKGSIGNIFYLDTPFWTVDTIFYTKIDQSKVIPKFFYYFLQTKHIEDLNMAGGVPSLTKAELDKICIPLPPLAIQEEIINILDKFTELQAELQARITQYEYYRNSLLSFGVVERESKRITWTLLGKIAMNCDYMRKPVIKSTRQSGQYPYYGASGIIDYVDEYIFDGDYLLISEDGANLLARKTPIAFSISGKAWVNNHAHVLKFENNITQRFVELYLNSIDLKKYIDTAAQPKLTQANLNCISVPTPSLGEQTRIVAILNRFDTLTNDLADGLPAEIEARRRQYEYYRDKLLTFEERTA
jgi:type I restriction enzyme S subunit